MILFQFQFSQVENEKEYSIIPDFCKWLCEQIFIRINTKVKTDKSTKMQCFYQIHSAKGVFNDKFRGIRKKR